MMKVMVTQTLNLTKDATLAMLLKKMRRTDRKYVIAIEGDVVFEVAPKSLSRDALRAQQRKEDADEAMKYGKTYTKENIKDLIPDLLADD